MTPDDRRAQRMLREHRGPRLTAAPGYYRWPDGCAATVEHIHAEWSAMTLYHPSETHEASDRRPDRDLEVTP